MADKVIIDEKLSTDGVIPVWARENTLQTISAQSKASTTYLKAIASNSLDKATAEKLEQSLIAVERDGTKSILGGFKGLSNDLGKDFGGLQGTLSNSFRSMTSSMTTLTRTGIIGVLENSVSKYSRSLLATGETATGLSATILSLSGTVLEGVGVLAALFLETQAMVDDFQKLYENGINFSEGLVGMTKAAGDLGLSVNELVTAFNTASATVTYLGTDRATKLSKQFTELNRTSGELGLTNTEAAQAVLEYTDMLRTVGSLQGKSNEELVKGASEYVQELNLLSNITGKSRKEQQKEIEARRKNLDLNLAIAGLPKEVQDKVRKATDQFNQLGPTMGDVFTKALASQLAGKGLSGLDSATQIMLTQSGLADILPKMAEDAKRTGNVTEDLGNALEKLGSPEMLIRLRNMANGTGAVADAARTFLQGQQESADARKREDDIREETTKRLQTYGNTLSETEIKEQVRQEFQKKANDNAAEMLKTQQKLEASVNTLKAAFDTMLTRNIIPLLPAFQKIADVVTVFGEIFVRVTDDLTIAFGGVIKYATILGEGFQSFSNLIKGILIDFGIMKPANTTADNDSRGDHDRNRVGEKPESAFSSLNIAKYATEAALGIWAGGKLTRGIGGVFGMSSKAASALPTPSLPGMLAGPELPGVAGATKGVGGILGKAGCALSGSIRGFGSLIGDAIVGVTDTLGKSSEGLKKFIVNLAGTIGGSAGELFAGLMTGLATGFKAFANPAIAEGAGIFAAAIAAVGAGIAGATWLVGEALPNLAAGMKSFEGINGANLKDVGLGMAGIGAGILALGAADVINAFGGLMKSVLSLFGYKDDPIEKFKKFGELAEPLNKVAPVMKMFADSWTQTLSALNSAKIDDSVTKTINDLSNILFVDNKAGFWSGKVTTASKVQELADSLGALAAKTADLQSAQSGTSATGAKLLSPSDLQKRTIGFYDDQKDSNAALISLLQMVNAKLDALHDTAADGHKDTVDAIKKSSGHVY